MTPFVRLPILPLLLVVAACGTQAPKPVVEAGQSDASAVPPAPTFERKPGATVKRGGGYYQDDGPLDQIPVNLASVPDAIPRHEPPHRFANRPYNVLGRDYVPLAPGTPYRREGIASWYGRKFHGQKTSSGEPYDMFGMTAAHPTLPIPSYVRVTRVNSGPDTGKSVTVRVNDRGPFLHDRVIDLSYTAAWKLGLIDNGSGRVVVESIAPGATPLPEHTPIQIAENKPREEPPTVLRDVEEKSGHYLQLGAFGSRDNAESLRIKLARELGDLGDKLLIRSSGALYRLQLGPWADIAEARKMAEQLKSAFDLPAILVK
ncbi:septal ring lytic transglycosylase RlpA family protein [Rhodocyclaceae bacterium]